MMHRPRLSGIGASLLFAACALLAGCERPPIDSVQRGFRGTGMDQVYNPRTLAAQAPLNAMPNDPPMVPAGGPPAKTVFKNLQVVGDLGVGEFTRLMVSMSAWIAPDQGCTYCHKPGEDFSSDSLYTKVVARRMLQMTRAINADWKTHVAETGVTCYTCHRGQPVPSNVWFAPPADRHADAMLGNHAGQNSPQSSVGLASLPYDPFTPFLTLPDGKPNEIRVIGTSALPQGNRQSIKQAEYTYGLMMHMTTALGVNCTYCHNTRSFGDWDASTPQRATAWYGIRMTRDLNTTYLAPLASTLPPNRHGPTGDGPMVNCATCHQGAFKPMYGASLLKTHPELVGVKTSVQPADAASAPASVAMPSVTLLFDVGSATLSGEAAVGLQPLLAALKTHPGSKVVISGFHSATGSADQNEELAKQRALSVRAALNVAGVPDDQIVMEKPQAAEATLASEDPRERRVDVALR